MPVCEFENSLSRSWTRGVNSLKLNYALYQLGIVKEENVAVTIYGSYYQEAEVWMIDWTYFVQQEF